MTRKEPLQERARETRERILATAAQLFSERGVAATSTNRVAQEARMSIGTLYRYFADKQQIVDELRIRLTAELEESFTASVLARLPLPPEQGIAIGLRGISDTLGARRSLVLALYGDLSLGDNALVGSMERRLVVLTRAYLLHLQGAIDDNVLDVRAHLMVTVGLATSLRFGLMPPVGVDSPALVEETARMLAAWLQT